MKKTRTPALLAMALVAVCGAASGQTSSQAGREISHLLQYVDQSGCQFNRNGSWHGSHEASLHLQRKYKYLQNRSAAPDADSFIDRAATQSSVSGKAYQVKCGDSVAIPSKQWLTEELARYRSTRNHIEKP